MSKFKTPKPNSRVEEATKLVRVSCETHKIIKTLSTKHDLSMTKMLEAIILHHDIHIDGDE
jgi:hypothetical protein